MTESIKVFAPATVANVGCGFDILGFAVDHPGDEVILRKSNKSGLRIARIKGDNGRLSLNPKSNTVGVAIQKYMDHLGSNQGIEISLHKKMPFESGLGSSAASAVAGVFAVNLLLGVPLDKKALLPFAMEAEKIACGSAHADNVAPSLLGGFVLVRSYEPLDIVEIPTPEDLCCALVHPQIEVKTKDARDILKKDIKLKDAVIQWGNVAGLITGLIQADYQLIGRSMQDVIVEPIRSMLIPGYHKAKQAALKAGALGAGISGSGPSIFSLSEGKENAVKVGEAFKAVYNALGIDNQIFVSKINLNGPQILD